jgi:signal transduction histidine kinase
VTKQQTAKKTMQQEVDQLRHELVRLNAANEITSTLGKTLDFDSCLSELVEVVASLTACERALALVSDDLEAGLKFGAINRPLASPESQAELVSTSIPTFNVGESPIVTAWLNGEALQVMPANLKPGSPVSRLSQTLQSNSFYSVPLMLDTSLVGVILVDNPTSPDLIDEDVHQLLQGIAKAAAIALQNARLHSKTVRELADNMHEMNVLRQIDRELNDTIELTHVFNMTLDWALRYTGAQAASLALYNQETDSLRTVADIGYDLPSDQLETLREQYGSGIAHRVARSGHSEVIPDVATDTDFVRLLGSTRSEMLIPVMREDRVIAVISVESKKLNGFTDPMLEFVEKLAARAGVAIDNARLYAESVREREKLSHILSNTADVIIVVGPDDRIILINQAAISALRLYPQENYIGQVFSEIVPNTALFSNYIRAKSVGERLIEELQLPNERTFHANLTPHEGIGWIIVMHDITPFKEMDQLKSELIATVSHDLKQPLSVMNGYIELLLMQHKFDFQGMTFVDMIRKSIQNMRQLIDDLLDLAKIESGIKLELQPIQLAQVLSECADAIKPSAVGKSMTLTTDFPENLPLITGDRARLRQIFVNLIGNAVKYTPPEGWVMVKVEERGTTLRIAIQDNGLGISPDDQAHIFDRFYRVRRPETDSIEGTGLGLAIVKSLVEAHNGQIGLESSLGEGSTFYVTLPIQQNGQLPSQAPGT